MDVMRKQQLHQLIRTLRSAQEHVRDLWLEECREERSPQVGKVSSGVVFHLEESTQYIQFAIEHLQDAACSADTKLA